MITPGVRMEVGNFKAQFFIREIKPLDNVTFYILLITHSSHALDKLARVAQIPNWNRQIFDLA